MGDACLGGWVSSGMLDGRCCCRVVSIGWGCCRGLSVGGEGAALTLTPALALLLGTLSNSCVPQYRSGWLPDAQMSPIASRASV